MKIIRKYKMVDSKRKTVKRKDATDLETLKAQFRTASSSVVSSMKNAETTFKTLRDEANKLEMVFGIPEKDAKQIKGFISDLNSALRHLSSFKL